MVIVHLAKAQSLLLVSLRHNWGLFELLMLSATLKLSNDGLSTRKDALLSENDSAVYAFKR